MRIHARAWSSVLLVTGLAAGFLSGSAASAISGAEPVADGELPFVAKVTFGDERGCTGALVDSRWIVTHKSCFADGPAPVAAGVPARPTTVLLGRTDLTKVTGHRLMVQSVVPHPDRNVVLAELSAPVKNIAPVALGAAAPQVGESLRIAGYGRTATEWVPNRLHAATFTVQSTAAATFEVLGASADATLCKGDAGGPAFRAVSGRFELVGISDRSGQKGCLAEPPTATAGAVETRADDLADWIRATASVQPEGLRDPVTGEFNRDGVQDLVAADAAGILWLYPGTGTRNAWAHRVQIGSGWTGYREFAVGRVNRDEYDDLVTIETATQKLWLYPGTPAGGVFGARVQIGSGWGPFRDLAIGKVNRDQYDDLLTVKNTDNKLYLYKGNAAGGNFDAAVEYGSGWQCCAQVTLGRFTNDDYDDLLTVDKATGKLRVYPGTATGQQFAPAVDPGAGTTWNTASFIARGRFDGTGLDGLLAVEASTGRTWLHQRTESGGWGSRAAPLGRLWAPQPYELTKLAVGELNRDAHVDLIGVDGTGRLWMHPGTPARTFGPRVQIGSGWGAYRDLVIARANRDQYDDLITIETATGKLWLYPGTATGGAFGTRVQIGSGWTTEFRDVAIGQVNRDQYDDLLVIKNADHKLYLYKGNEKGGNFDAAATYGTGWNCCAQVVVGGFTADGYDDLITVDSATGRLRIYTGNAGGVQFDPGVDPGAGAVWKNRTELVAVPFGPDGHDALLSKDGGALVLNPTTAGGTVDWADPVRFGPRD